MVARPGWESGKPAFGFPLFHPPSSPELWKCGNLARSWRDFQGAVERGGSLLLAFHAFHSPGISTALFLAWRWFWRPIAASFAFALAFRLLVLFGVLHPVARDVQLDYHAMMHQSIDRRGRHHRVFEDGFPLRERQIARH